MGLIDIPTDGTVLAVGFTSDGRIDAGATTLPGFLAGIAEQSWSDLRGQLPGALRDLLNGRRIAEGMNLYDVVVKVAADCAMSISRTSAGDLEVSVVTGRNTVIASTTTDSWFGSYADPRFSLDFGLAFVFEVDLPPVAGPVGVTGFRDLRITMPHLDSQNLVGDLALFAVSVVEFFTGWNLDGTLARILDGLDLASRANGVLAPLNGAIAALASKGFNYLSVLAGDPADLARQLGAWADAAGGVLGGLPGGTQSLMLLCRKPDTSGVIEGEISWKDAEGGPVDRRMASLVRDIASASVSELVVERATTRLAVAQVTPDLSLERALPADAALAPDLEQTAIAVAALPTAGTLQLGAITTPQALRVWDAAVTADPPFTPSDVAGAVRGTVFETLVGSRAAYEAITDEFRRGPNQFDVAVVAPDAGGGHPTGRLVGTWYDDGDGWHRRRFRIEDVETDVPLQVTCALASDYVWSPDRAVDISARHWDGTVTVHPPIDFAQAIRDGLLQASVKLADGERRTVTIADLESAGALHRPDGSDRSIIIVGGVPGDEVALNPQPLPPRILQAIDELGAGQSVLLATARDGDNVALNPQPLPPRWRDEFGRRFHGHQVVVRGQADQVRAQGVLDDFAVERLGGGIARLAGRLRAGQWGRRAGQDQLDQVGRQAPTPAQSATQTTVDRFGDLTVTEIDPDVIIPDVHNPVGHGTVRGIDFRVWLA